MNFVTAKPGELPTYTSKSVPRETSSEVCADIVCVTNVPTPYRLHLFDALNREAQKRGARFQVAFMAPSLPDRRFHEDLQCSDADLRIYNGWRCALRERILHLNPGLVWSLVRRPPKFLITGGWCDFTSALILLIFPTFRRSTLVLSWVEDNSNKIKHKSGVIASVRTFLLRRCHAFVVPGSIAKQTVKINYHIQDRKFLTLPNIVDEQIFSDRVKSLRTKQLELRAELGLSPSQKIVVCCARIEERLKGLMNFLGHVKDLWTDNMVLLVAGTGPDVARTQSWLKENAMSGKVCLLGHQKTDALLRLLAVADAFVLPSLADANPLSAIEAAWAGLPLLLSSHCGNWPELVLPGVNGWVFDPSEAGDVRAGFAELAAASAQELRAMGTVSENRARLLYSTQSTVRAFLDDIYSLELGRSHCTI
jgi:glycosyltransferase involved in cell wall biosynthesis